MADATLEAVSAMLSEIQNGIETLPQRIVVSAGQIFVVNGLSDIHSDLGTVTAGEFRTGNQKAPGSGFTGVRIGYPPFTYSNDTWHIAGVNADALQFGVQATTGKLIAGGGAVVLDATGITATAGSIGGFSIQTDHLRDVANSFGLSSVVTGGDDVRFWAGATHANRNTAPFRATEGGVVTMTTGNILGLLTVGAATPTLQIDGSNKYIQTSNYSGGTVGLRITAAGDAEFNNITARGAIHTAILTYGHVHSTGGSVLIARNAGKLRSSVTTVDSPTTFNVDIEDPEGTSHASAQIFLVNDILRIKDGTSDAWMTVSSVSDQTTFWRYVCTKSSPGAGTNYTFVAGSGVVDYGQSGQGFLYMTADDTNGPFYSVRTHAGSPWTTTTELARMGNLKNSFGVGANNRYGFAAGDFAAGNYMLYNPTDGFKIVAQNGNTTITGSGIFVANDNAITFGAVGGGTGIRIKMSTADDFQLINDLASKGFTFYIKLTDASTPNMLWREIPTNKTQLSLASGVQGGRLVLTGGSTTHTFQADVAGASGGITQFMFGANNAASDDFIYIVPAARTSGAPRTFRLKGAADTGRTASTEVIDVDFNLARTATWTAGNIATQRFVIFQAPTIAFASGSNTVTTTATVAITGAPAAGANATLTHPVALWIQAGRVLLGGTATVAPVGIEYAQSVTASGGQALGGYISDTLTATANSDALRGLQLNLTYAKGSFTGLTAASINIGNPAVTGGGTIATYAALIIYEPTIATANVGLLIGSHPGGSTNYAVYANSANASYFGGDVSVGAGGVTGVDANLNINSGGSTSARALINLLRNSAAKVILGVASDTNSIITGTVANDFALRSNGSMLFSTDSGTSAAMKIAASGGGIQVGAPTGGDKGAGTINTAGDIYKNNSAYTNPDYVLEDWVTGGAVRYADRPGAADYRRLSLDELEAHIRATYRLPHISNEPAGIFDMADIALEKIEELTTHLIEMHHRITALERNVR